MDLSDFYPKPADLIDLELKVLEHLRNNTYIKEHHPQVAQAAATYYQRNRNVQNNRKVRSRFEFHSSFDVYHSQMRSRTLRADRRGRALPNIKLTVSARIGVVKGAISDVSYCLSVCRMRRAGLTILRKFHFDTIGDAENAPGRSQQHPRCHLQYCGEMLPYMGEVGCREAQLEQMHPWLSEPRILYWPMSLALLIDMALHEFPDQHSAKFRAENHWRGLVHSHEDLLLRPFCAKCIEVITNRTPGALTLSEAFDVS